MIKCQSIRHSTQGRTRYELPGLNIPGLVFKESWLPHIQGVEHRVNMVHVIFIHRGERLVPILVLVNSDDNWDIGAHAIIFLVQRALPCARLRCCIWYPSMFYVYIFWAMIWQSQGVTFVKELPIACDRDCCIFILWGRFYLLHSRSLVTEDRFRVLWCIVNLRSGDVPDYKLLGQ